MTWKRFRRLLAGLFIGLLGPTAKPVLETRRGPLAPGSEVPVVYISCDRPNQDITVEIDDGRNPPTTQILLIRTDRNGHGRATWRVPTDWDTAAFNAPGAHEIFRVIEDPPPEPPVRT